MVRGTLIRGRAIHGAWRALQSSVGTAFKRRSYPLGHAPALDGLRGFLILAVLAGHSNLHFFSGSSIYMDTFFVLSGYLITSLLLLEFERTGSVNLVAFYRGRLRRVYPALCAMVLGVLAISAIIPTTYPMTLIEAAVGLLSFRNYYQFIFDASRMGTSAHMWSLAVEEQFYLLWPVAFIYLIRRWGVSWRAVSLLGCIALSVAVLRAFGMYQGFSRVGHLYPTFHMRADSLLVGCALAFVPRLVDCRKSAILLRRLLMPVLLASIATVFTMEHLAPVYFYSASALASLGSATVIAGLIYANRSVLHRIFENSFLMCCGRISYGLYLWHWPIFIFLIYEGSELMPLRMVLAWILTFMIAALSYSQVEVRFSRRSARKAESRADSLTPETAAA
jgi:peptidoglycan/LPS O-acetylase OafA/YrhL